MTSSFGWLDTDASQRTQMLEIVDLFREEGAVDEIGIGSIRDALSDSLFPGTSVLHTRLRYVLFIPWLLERAAKDRTTETDMAAGLRRLEVRLISSLLNGDEFFGVIGNTARSRLKRMPSSVYWAALDTWQIRDANSSTIDGYFRRAVDLHQLAKLSPDTAEADSRERPPSSGFDAYLPTGPTDLLKATTFALTPDEEQYLSDRIVRATAGSALAWLIQNPPGNSPDFVWNIDNLGDAPEHLQQLIDHARRFHTAIYGATLLYNLLLARKSEREDAIARYEAAIEAWRTEVRETRVVEDWDRSSWWATIHRQKPQLRATTRIFVNTWFDLINKSTDIAHSPNAEKLIATREKRMKGGRARLFNQAALDRWSGESAVGRLDFRWHVAQRHLADLYNARTAA